MADWFGSTDPEEPLSLGQAEELVSQLSGRIRASRQSLHELKGWQLTTEERPEPNDEMLATISPAAVHQNEGTQFEWTFVTRLATDSESRADVTMVEVVDDSQDQSSTEQTRTFRLFAGWRKLLSEIA